MSISEMLPEVRQNTSHHIVAAGSNAEFAGWVGGSRLAEQPRGAVVVQASQDLQHQQASKRLLLLPLL